MSKDVIGRCKLCGQERKLTFEHVPPEKAFNSSSVKLLSFEDSLKLVAGTDDKEPLDISNLKGITQQRGSGGYYLCSQCNNNTGSWYIREYVTFAKTISYILSKRPSENSKICTFELLDLYPLRLFKAIMTLFCDINNDCFGDESLRQFLINRESTNFNHDKYKVYFYISKGPMMRVQEFCGMIKFGVGNIFLSEISSYPMGFVLYIDAPKNYIPDGICINDLATANYDEKKKVQFINVPFLEVNTQYPADFRTKKEIMECINNNNEQ